MQAFFSKRVADSDTVYDTTRLQLPSAPTDCLSVERSPARTSARSRGSTTGSRASSQPGRLFAVGSSLDYCSHDDDTVYACRDSSAPLTTDRFYAEYGDFQLLGKGDFGTVTAATYAGDGQRYAVKTSNKAITGATDEQHRLQEVFALSIISATSHVLRYYDAWIEEDRLYIATELLSHGNVRSLCAEAWPEQMLWHLTLQAALGIHALHSSNVAHLDIKPDNLLYDRDEATSQITIKIGDFGLARPLDAEVKRSFVGLNDDEGDSRYLSPELLQSPTHCPYLKEADMYSLGMTLVDLAGGDPKRVRLAADYSATTHLSPQLQALIRGLTAVNPTHRPTAFQVVREATDLLVHQHRVIPASEAAVEHLTNSLATIDALAAELRELEAAERSALQQARPVASP